MKPSNQNSFFSIPHWFSKLLSSVTVPKTPQMLVFLKSIIRHSTLRQYWTPQIEISNVNSENVRKNSIFFADSSFVSIEFHSAKIIGKFTFPLKIHNKIKLPAIINAIDLVPYVETFEFLYVLAFVQWFQFFPFKCYSGESDWRPIIAATKGTRRYWWVKFVTIKNMHCYFGKL